MGSSLVALGDVAREQGDFVAASSRYNESLAIQRELGHRRGIAYSLDGLASIAAPLGDALRAARIWGAGERLREEAGLPMSPAERSQHDRLVGAVRATPGVEAAFARAWQEGRALTLEQAMELALG